MGEALVRNLDIQSGEQVLDVAAENGKAARPAAQRFADVLAVDYVPGLPAEAKARANAEGVVPPTESPTFNDVALCAAASSLRLWATGAGRYFVGR